MYKIEYRNKIYGYNAYFVLKRRFKTKESARKWIRENKEEYIDKIKIMKE